MNKLEALAIDQKYKMLPGGQGEHEFWLSGGYHRVSADLCNFAEQCGGYFGGIGAGLRARLSTCDCGDFLITISPDKTHVVKIEQVVEGRDRQPILYWDARRERVEDYGYQIGNADKPFLSDWELTDDELAADQVRIERELAETPPPPPPRIDHAKIFRDSLGLTAEQVQCPHLHFAIHHMQTAFCHGENPMLHSEVTTLDRIKRVADREYHDRSTYIFLGGKRQPESSGPQTGDVVLRVLEPGQYMHNYRGVVTRGYAGDADKPLSVCFSASAMWNPIHALHGFGGPECSGGPWDQLVMKNCRLAGTALQNYWYWRDGFMGAGNGVSYAREVNIWHWVD